MNIRISDAGGYNIHVDTSEKWLLFKALDALMSSNSIDSYEERLVRDMMNKFREDGMNSSRQIKSGHRRNRYNNPDFNNDRIVFDYDVDDIIVDEDIPFDSEPIDPSWIGAEEHDEDYYHYRDMGEMYGSGVRSSRELSDKNSEQIKSDWEKVDMASGPIWDSSDGHWRIFEKDGKWVLRNLEYSQTKDCFYNSFEEASQKAEDIDFVIDDEVYKRLEGNPDIDVESVYEKVARKVIETESFFHK